MQANGIILLDKEPGYSSAAAISKVKRALSLDKIGHAGTLDPFASGLLVCLCGKTTRLASYAEKGDKEYSGTIKLGVRTSSNDLTGEILSESVVAPFDQSMLDQLALQFSGVISQRPPDISAIKIDGRPAYKIARGGETPELKERLATVHSIALQKICESSISYRIRCSKGTYIRSIARDLGELLNCGAAVESLRRLYSAPFSVANATKVNELLVDAILPWDMLFVNEPRISVSESEVKALASGNVTASQEVYQRAAVVADAGRTLVLYCDERGTALGILVLKNGAFTLGIHVGS